ncbi:hypothetical protein FN846DRAFT_889788 [Sphaerosporella brunnea]|uniref:C3H1-type domain-containing protein n=1 Tax=Sphaerosporella brunnea TaxID=1250544 RepID=A0A5J5EYQ5_9PEZI|nr:hypothetical protein FN846DRAFT_889788 [Sphaerosporella brunnea]
MSVSLSANWLVNQPQGSRHRETRTPEPEPASAPAPVQAPAGDNTVVSVPMAFPNKMTDTMSALTGHLSALPGPQALSAPAQPALGTTPPPSPPPQNQRFQSICNRWPAWTLPTYQKFSSTGSRYRRRRATSRSKSIRYLLDLNERCTWHSVCLHHFSFRRKRVHQGVYGWGKFSDPKLDHLLESRGATGAQVQARGPKRPAEGSAIGLPAKPPARTSVPSSSLPQQRVPGACRRHNRGLCAASSKCMYQHVCWTSGEDVHTASACPQVLQ